LDSGATGQPNRDDPAGADAAREAGIEAVVGLSQWLASPTHPAALTRGVWMADRILGALPGVAHPVLNPGFFGDNYLRLVGFAAQLGMLPSLTGESRNAPPSNEDIRGAQAASGRRGLKRPNIGRHARRRPHHRGQPTSPRAGACQWMAAGLARPERYPALRRLGRARRGAACASRRR
jgi:hypothetical protein